MKLAKCQRMAMSRDSVRRVNIIREDADVLCSNCTANQRLCFRICNYRVGHFHTLTDKSMVINRHERKM